MHRPDRHFLLGLGQRFISALLLATITVVYLVAGGWYFSALVIVISVLLAHEWVGLMRPATPRHRYLMLAMLGGFIIALVLGATLSSVHLTLIGCLVAVIGIMTLIVFRHRRYLAGALGGMVYIGLPALSLMWLRNEQGAEAMLVLWLFLIVWSTDTGAFLVGSAFGGHKLAPRISPGKTWSGAIGGAAAAAIIGGTLSFFFGGEVMTGAAIATLLSILAQLGDLFESMLKRRAAVKHSGDLIPGHGGMLDRLDGLLFAAPALALVMILLEPRLVG